MEISTPALTPQCVQDVGPASEVTATMSDENDGVPPSRAAPISYRQHLVEVSKLTYPIVLNELFQNTLPVMDIAFLGRLGKEELGAAALATAWFNLWNHFMVGFMTAIDTMLSQAHGAGDRKGFAAWAGNSLVVVLVVTIAVSGMVALCGPVMLLFGQDPDLAAAAGAFSLRLVPGLFPYYAFKVLTKYLQTQNVLGPAVWIGLAANATNALFNWGLIFAAGWGIEGAPWATTLTRAAEFVIVVAYVYAKRGAFRDTLPTVSRENLRIDALRPFLKLAGSGAMSLSAEAWSFEVTTILAGLLGVVALDANIITLTIVGFVFLSFPFGVAIAASIRTGQLIGDRRAEDARRSARASYALASALQFVLAVVLWPLSDRLGALFSKDAGVAGLVARLIPVSCVFMMGDAVQAVTGGVLRGAGRQKLVLYLNLLAFWVLGVPAGVALTFPAGLGVHGLWWGLNIGIYVSCVVGIWCLRRLDWDKEVAASAERRASIVKTKATEGPPVGETIGETNDNSIEAMDETV